MQFRVADRLGKTVYQLSNEMSYEELIQWGIYYDKVEPTRVTKQDLYLARIAYICAANPKAKFNDFIIKYTDDKKKQSGLTELSAKDMAVMFKMRLGMKE